MQQYEYETFSYLNEQLIADEDHDEHMSAEQVKLMEYLKAVGVKWERKMKK